MLAVFSGVCECSSSEDEGKALFLGECVGEAECDVEVRPNLGLVLVLLKGLLRGLGERGDAGKEGRLGDLTGDGDLEDSLVWTGRTDLPRVPVHRSGEGVSALGDLDLERSRGEAGGIRGVGANRFLLACSVAGVSSVGSM